MTPPSSEPEAADRSQPLRLEAGPEAPRELRGAITWRALLAGAIVAAMMGTAYPYMVLKLGFGPNVSVVSAFFGFLFLRLIDLVTRERRYDRWQNNLAEAAGTSAAQTAFMCILLGAFDLLRDITGGSFRMELSPWTSFAWLTAAATLGVLLAVPLRRHFIIDEKLPYVDGLTAAETITVLDPPRGASPEVRRQALLTLWAMVSGVVIAGLVMALRADARLTDLIPDAYLPKWHTVGETLRTEAGAAVVTGVVLAKMNVGISFSLLSVGSGMLLGMRINVSMILGGTLAWIVAPTLLVTNGMLTDPSTGAPITTPSSRQVLFWVMWPATGMLVAGGLTALALRWRLLVETFRSLRSARIDSAELSLRLVVPGIAVSTVALCIIQYQLLHMPVWMTLVAIALSIPLMLVGLRVLGETNWGPISALSNMMQGLFAAVAPGNMGANMVASGTTGTIATSSEMIMQDYKCGHLVGTKPRIITIMQLLAIPVGAAAVSLIYPVLVKSYRIVDQIDPVTGQTLPAGLTSPISQKWAGFAKILQDGPGALPVEALYALLVFSVLGVVLTVLESRPRLKRWVPSPSGVGIGMLVPFAVIFTMFIGSVVGWIWQRVSRRSADAYMVPFGSGLIAGEALVAVIAAIYIGATSL